MTQIKALNLSKPWRKFFSFAIFAVVFFGMISSAFAVEGGSAPHLDGSTLTLIWGIPFVGVLLSIAIFPLIAPIFWHNNFGKVAAFWAATFLIPFFFTFGWQLTLYEILHVGLLEYIPFIILLLSLYTVAGGVRITGGLQGTPAVNSGLLLFGTVIASWMGTTGAAMLLIRPVLNANAWRAKKVHIVVFFIFLVANIGGSLTPLGDPPLFLGFLKGVDFFWPLTHMFLPMTVLTILLIGIFYGLDTYLYRKEENKPEKDMENNNILSIRIEGAQNILLLVGIVGAVLLSGVWDPGITFDVYHVEVDLQNLVRDLLLLSFAALSLQLTGKKKREENEFTWFPIIEVAKLFAGIFITIVPVIAILKAGQNGAMSGIINLVISPDGTPNNPMFFWATGILSSFLDNAPTYLVFFNTAGGQEEVQFLMTDWSNTLLAISAGAVFMGAMTYIGNAPNFMVRSIAMESGVPMPSFFGYMLWSCAILVPLFLLITFLFFT